ncbi:hypothetical protein [Streptomyces sp. N35]|uniref:hypothetical protein n=1 Tax=Streptomyces sp. N35 TaxID=2795730 RepID=UPI0018F6B89E|nr:hypothetical protein [Streptomyces sp. N35]
MIPATEVYIARYKVETEQGTHYETRPIVAWDDTGYALVADTKKGRLVRANKDSNFAGLQLDEEAPVIAALPGGGWTALFAEDAAGSNTEPVLAWHVFASGFMKPIVMERGGMPEDPTEIENFVRLVAPGEETDR